MVVEELDRLVLKKVGGITQSERATNPVASKPLTDDMMVIVGIRNLSLTRYIDIYASIL